MLATMRCCRWSAVDGRPAFRGAGVGFGISANPRPEVQADIIRNLIPGSRVGLDPSGNVIVEIGPDNERGVEPGKYVVNEPGASAQDIFDILVPLVQFTPAGRVAGRVAGGWRAFPRGVQRDGVGPTRRPQCSVMTSWPRSRRLCHMCAT